MALFALVVAMTIVMKLQVVIYTSVRNVKSKHQSWQALNPPQERAGNAG